MRVGRWGGARKVRRESGKRRQIGIMQVRVMIPMRHWSQTLRRSVTELTSMAKNANRSCKALSL